MARSNLRRGLGPAAVGLLAVAVAGTPTARGQPFQPPPGPNQPPVQIRGGDTDLFRALLDYKGVEPVRRQDLFGLRPDEDLIVVVLGAATPWDESLRWARRAVAAGGAALVASDAGFDIHEAGNDPNLGNPRLGRFTGEGVTADWRNRNETHNGTPECPYAVPVSPDELPDPPNPPGRAWAVFRGLTRVATNQPTYIDILPRDFRNEYRYPLARFPRSARSPAGLPLGRAPLLAVGGDGPTALLGPAFSFLAVADPSVYINQMLMEDGTDNLEFALRTVEYLQGPNKERKRCLFYENGRVVERFDGLRGALAPPRPPVPPEAVPNVGPLFGKHQDKLVGFLDAKADELQQRDVLHRSLVGPEGSERERKSAAAWAERAAALLSVAVAFVLLRRLWGARHPQDGPPAPNTGAGAASTGPPGVFDRRQKELVRRNNVYEPVKALVREFFAAAGAPPDPGPRMPPVDVSDAVRKPGSLHQALRDMWRLAYGPPAALTAQRWYELEPYFERLRQAHADGKWRFLSE